MRGGPAFALSLVLSAVEPALRAAAELGAWQVISPVNALGRVAVVEGLHEVQDEVLFLRVDKCSVNIPSVVPVGGGARVGAAVSSAWHVILPVNALGRVAVAEGLHASCTRCCPPFE